jgi:phosphoglycolate phosphatase-like HAD superfamily hydrolase
VYGGVIFDNDGVLVPVCSFSVFREATRRTFDSFGVEPSEAEVQGVAGVERKKPNTHYLDQVMADLGVSNPLFVGDSESDVRVAENAGLDSVFRRRDHRADYDLSVTPTYELDSLRGLPTLLN